MSLLTVRMTLHSVSSSHSRTTLTPAMVGVNNTDTSNGSNQVVVTIKRTKITSPCTECSYQLIIKLNNFIEQEMK